MALNARKILNAHETVVLILPETVYLKKLIEVIRDVTEEYKNICYLSVIRPYTVLIQELDKNKIDNKKFFFIDCVSGGGSNSQQTENCVFVDSPESLTEILRAINSALDERKPEVLIIDSPSTLAIYSDSMEVVRLMHTLVTKLRMAGCKGIFPCIKDEKNSMLLKDLEMFADEVIDMQK
jgi:hypothetical protein